MRMNSKRMYCICVVLFLCIPQIYGQSELPLKGPDGETYLSLGELQQVQYDPMNEALAMSSSFGMFGWDLSTQRIKSAAIDYKSTYTNFMISQDGKLKITLHENSAVKEIRESSQSISVRTFTNVKGHKIFALSQDGKLMIASDTNDNLRIWNTDTMTEQIKLEEIVNDINYVVLSPKSDYLLSISEYDYTLNSPKPLVKLWSVKTGKCISELNIGDELNSFVEEAVFSPDDQYVITYGRDGYTELWSTSKGELVTMLDQQYDKVLFLEDDSFLALKNNQIDLFGSEGSAYLAGIESDAGFRFYKMINGGDGTLLFFSYKKEGTTEQSKLTLWDVRSRSTIITFPFQEHLYPLFTVPNKNYLVSWYPLSNVEIIDLKTGKILYTIKDFTRSYQTLSGMYGPFSEDGKLYSRCFDRRVDFYSADSNTLIRSVSLDGINFWNSIFQSGKYLAYVESGQLADTVTLMDGYTTEIVTTINLSEDLGSLRLVQVSKDGRLLLICFYDKAELWDIRSETKIREIQPVSIFSFNESLIFSPDGKYLLLSGEDVYQLQDIQTGTVIQTFTSQSRWGNQFDISKDSTIFAVANNTGIENFDYQTGKKIKSLDGFKSSSNGGNDNSILVRISPDKHFVLLASSSGSILINYETGKIVKEFHGYQAGLGNVIFTEDGNSVVFAYFDGNRSVWDISGIVHPEREISFQGQTTEAGSLVSIPVVIDYSANVLGFLLTIKYDDSILTFRQAKSGSLTQEILPVSHTNAGILKVAMATEKSLAGNGSLCELEFMVSAGDASPDMSVFEILSAQLNDGTIGTRIRNGKINVSTAASDWYLY